MKRALLILPAFSLFSCISFPRAEAQARQRQMEQAESNGQYEASRQDAPAVKTRENFQDRYFR
ncbi:MAG TPA: hypothetical protein VGE29_00075 [Prosthecobacter sp.]